MINLITFFSQNTVSGSAIDRSFEKDPIICFILKLTSVTFQTANETKQQSEVQFYIFNTFF